MATSALVAEDTDADRLRHLMATRPWCYWVFPNWWSIDDANRYTISIVVEREAGHYPTGTAGTDRLLTRADDYEAACAEACDLNRALGISDRETARIVASMLGATSGRGERLL